MIEAIQAMLNSMAIAFDLPILDWIQDNLTCLFLDIAMPIITLFGDGGIFWILCAVILMILPKTRKTGLGMIFALLLGLLVCNITIKPLVARPRPYDFQLEHFGKEIWMGLLSKTPTDYSFPSGHTIASFEACTVLLLNDKRLGIPALILSCLIAFSRLYLYVHYPTDVIFALVLGILFGLIGNALAKCIKLPGGKRGKFERVA